MSRFVAKTTKYRDSASTATNICPRMDCNLHKKATVPDRAVILNEWFFVNDHKKITQRERENIDFRINRSNVFLAN